MADKPPASQSVEMLQDEVRRLRRAVDELSILNDLARAIGASLNGEEIMQIIIRRSLREVNADQGVITLGGTSNKYRSFIQTEYARWQHVVKESGAKVE